MSRATFPRKGAAARLAASVLLPAILLTACSPRRPPPNVLLITLDTTRADRLGCYGYAAALTPALDELARTGALLENAFSSVPLTLPAHASILTGLYPPEHGLRANGESRLGETVPTLTAALRAKGYETGAFIASFVLDSQFGLDRDFARYDDEIKGAFDPGAWLRRSRPGNEVVDAAIDWLGGVSNKPFFCWVHLYDPHHPYLPHADLFGGRFLKDPYDGDVAFMDRQIGRLLHHLKRRNLARRTIVIAVGDHGESLGDHGEEEHGLLLYNGALQVPLIIAQPGRIPSGLRVREPVSIVDVAPTVLELAGGEPIPCSGVSLLPSLAGRTAGPRTLYAETDLPFLQFRWAPLRAILSAGQKFIQTTRPELYDLAADPGEQHNLAPAETDTVRRFAETLAGMEGRFTARGAEAVDLTEDGRRALESLGYAARFDRSSMAPSTNALPDVKDMISLTAAGTQVRALLKAGKTQEAIRYAEGMRARDPDNPDLRIALASALGANGDVERAAALLVDIQNDRGQTIAFDAYVTAALMLSKCYREMDRTSDAASVLRDLLQTDPSNMALLNEMAWILATAPHPTGEQAVEAVALADRVIAAVGRSSYAHMDTLAAACATAGQFHRAVEIQTEAVELARKAGAQQSVQDFTHRLELYRNGQRYAESPAVR